MMVPMRFLAVSVLGVALDIGLAWFLATGFGVRLWVAGAIGFAAAALLNYVLHEAWTFETSQNRRSAKRFGRYLVSLGMTAAVRLGAIVSFELALGAGRGTLIVLLLSTALSFCASFLLARFWVFQNPRDQRARL